MEYRIETLQGKKLVGMRFEMTFADDKTGTLWSRFMPLRNSIDKRISDDLFSIQVYPPAFFEAFNPNALFEKWAATEVSDFNELPSGLQPFELPKGLYVVFLYKGRAANASDVFKYILGEWMHASRYLLDNRPHFEILGNKYRNDHPDSEEEIWIPVRLKQ